MTWYPETEGIAWKPPPNPYIRNGKWYFYDEIADEYGPYRSLKAANRGLTAYCYWLNNGPTRWQRIWWPVRNAVAAWVKRHTIPRFNGMRGR